jgi:F-type H+-transporting ATPase subunit b
MEKFLQTPETWVLVAFIFFMLFAIWKGWTPLMGALDKRAATISNEIDEARKLRDEAQALLAEYQRKQRDAADEAQQMLKHAEEEAERVRARAEDDLKASLARREQQARDRIAQAEAQAIADVRNIASEVALLATARLISTKLDHAAAQSLIDQTIDSLPGHLN